MYVDSAKYQYSERDARPFPSMYSVDVSLYSLNERSRGSSSRADRREHRARRVAPPGSDA